MPTSCGLTASRIRRALVSGEAFLPAVRELLAARGIDGVPGLRHRRPRHRSPTRPPAREGLVLRRGADPRDRAARAPATPCAEGEVGEVVVTTFNADYPLMRFATGDLSAMLAGREPLRPHQRAHQGLDGARRPDDQGARHVRASAPGGGGAAPPRARTRAARGRERGRRGSHDAARASARRPTRTLAGAVEATLREVTKVRGEVEWRRARIAARTTAR